VEKQTAQTSTCLTFEDNSLLPLLFGEQDRNLSKLEKELLVDISSRGNQVSISGSVKEVKISEEILNEVYLKLQNGKTFEEKEVDVAIRQYLAGVNTKKDGGNKKRGSWKNITIKTQKREIVPFSKKQAEYIEAIMSKDLTFASGPAGTGKTYFAVAVAAQAFLKGEVDRIILSRPAVEAGEKLGFLPGDLKEKIDPYLRPLYDALHDMMPSEKVKKHMENGDIEVAPLAFMRGRTLKHSFVILDEAQNVTPTQMKMFLTRMGEGSHMVINGDMSQTDLPHGEISGLDDAKARLGHLDEISFVEFKSEDIVRHDLTAKIIEAYDK
jgi:phosphate starvation-inducible PhoH-like protein